MPIFRLLALALLFFQFPPPSVDVPTNASPAWLSPYRDASSRLIGEAVSSDAAWQRLAYLGDTFGNRLSGSPNLEAAIRWAVDEMKKDGLENVHAEPVKVPHWVRGRESLEIAGPIPQPLVMLGLGNSVGTPADGIEAELIVVHSFEELDASRGRVKGRIVLFNVPFTTYGETVRFRSTGPSRVGALGGVAMLVRSVGPAGLRTPHTGALAYADDQPRIPAAAVTAEDAARLQRMVDRGAGVRLKLMMEAHFLPDADSANVVGDLRGRELPDEVVLVSGHFDSWDIGTGSTDDGGGVVAAWEALRLMKKLDLRPRRTIRVVLWTNEENGGRGGLAYRDRHLAELAKHVLMLESDSGVFRPTGFGFTGSDTARARVREIATLLSGIHANAIGAAGGGADIAPSVQQAAIPSMSLEVDGDYFLIHHTPADTVDKIEPLDVARSAAAIAVMAYVVAEMPERIR
ncbi:MAG TPA: M20/M25/M40 family metallo-hydrolase [Vicinamibacterales bacterium]|jgi:carboxypeptidase Q|nr:M20/M25/M40 family metallo-hydrolase [Vicinamibacterales bacterium]